MVNKVTWEISQSQDLVQTWTSSLTYIRLFVYTCLWWIGKSLADIYILYTKSLITIVLLNLVVH